MPKLKQGIPKLCQHTRGQAFVKIGGQQVWLGRYGDALTQEKYDRLMAEWLANGRTLPQAPPPAATPASILSILAPYWRWATGRYTKAEADTIKSALRLVEKLYGSTPAIEFGPNALRVVRAEMVRKGWTRKQINRQISRVRGFFRWAASHELLHETVYNQLRTVEPLRRGDAPERPKVKPVPRRLIRVVRHRVARQVRALIDLQLLTAARADELVDLRLADLDRSRDVWAYNPEEHKTAHHDKEKWLYFGPKAQRILKMFLDEQRPVRYIFSPKEAERKRYDGAEIHRRLNQKPNQRKTERELGEHYTTASYRRAIHRALEQAFPVPKGSSEGEAEIWRKQHRWGPHRLRHNAATFLRREFGVEIAQAILGHSNISTTLIYAERAERRIREVMQKVG